MDHGKLVGIVTERDLHLIETLPDADPDEIKVDEAMTENLYTAAPGDEVADVVERMAERRIGSVIVMDANRVEGIFTAADALRVLANVLRRTVDPR
jgi:acetoin utilization protein AcuB